MLALPFTFYSLPTTPVGQPERTPIPTQCPRRRKKLLADPWYKDQETVITEAVPADSSNIGDDIRCVGEDHTIWVRNKRKSHTGSRHSDPA